MRDYGMGHAVGRRLEARLVHEERTAADDLLTLLHPPLYTWILSLRL